MLDIDGGIISSYVSRKHNALYIISGSINICEMNKWMDKCIKDKIWPSPYCHYCGTKMSPLRGTDSSYPWYLTAQGGHKAKEQIGKHSMYEDKEGKGSTVMSSLCLVLADRDDSPEIRQGWTVGSGVRGGRQGGNAFTQSTNTMQGAGC